MIIYVYATIGIVLIILGIALNIMVSRRKFYKRNAAGLEAYRTYSSAVFNKFLNKVLRLLGIVLLIVGVVLIGMLSQKKNRDILERSYHASLIKESRNK